MKHEILIVDDEPGIRKVLSIALADMGHPVGAAADGRSAVAACREKRPPIVLLDIRMPGMDGIETLSVIKKELPETEVIMMTGHGDMDLAIRSLKLDATDFIQKPIRDDHLSVALDRAAARIALREELNRYTRDLERMVAEKTEKLLDAERRAAVGETVAGLSHSIRNLAGGLSGGLFVLQKGIELENRGYLQQGFSMVKGNAERMSRLSLDLISYAKSQELCYEMTDVNEPAREVFEAMLPRAEREGVDFSFRPAPEAMRRNMDGEGIRLALSNLVTNSLDACAEAPKNGRNLKIILAVKPLAGGGIEYRVEDTGCGLDEEAGSRIFKGFFSTKGAGGTGIGLVLTRNIAARHGGTIEFSSEKGRGASFAIRLPECGPTREGN